MAFYIADRTYSFGSGRKPESFGFIEGYTSNTAGATMLRVNIKEELDEERREWYLRLYGHVPCDVHDIDPVTHRHFLRERRIGDAVGTGIRLDRRQVVRLILELIKWLVKGH